MWSTTDGTDIGGADELDVLGQHSARRRSGGWRPGLAPPLQLAGIQSDIKSAVGNVQDDFVAVLEIGDGSAVSRLGRNVTDA